MCLQIGLIPGLSMLSQLLRIRIRQKRFRAFCEFWGGDGFCLLQFFVGGTTDAHHQKGAAMKEETKKIYQTIANTIRSLSMDAIQKANSGHPGLPLGCAEIGAFLYGHVLNQDPKDPLWLGRDRFVLAAGHGSMLLYSCLHLAGFDLSLEDLKNFRQLHSKTPGHPEYCPDHGVEATTGPLGQGVGNAVGMALGLKILSARFGGEKTPLFAGKVYCLASDGCFMEGATSEVSSLAGHWNLNNLVLIYDANRISLDGPLSDCMSENTKERYLSYGWDVVEMDGYDLEAMEKIFDSICTLQKKPTLIIARTVIGKGSPHKAGSCKAHGSPLGEEEVKATKMALHIPEEPFYIPQEVKKFFETKRKDQEKKRREWQALFQQWKQRFPDLFAELNQMQKRQLPADLEELLKEVSIKTPSSGRESSHAVINKLSSLLPDLYTGSADLSSSDKCLIEKSPFISAKDFLGRNIKFGVREFGMGTIMNGLAYMQLFRPVCGTFLVFSDYMRNAMRLAALSSLPVIYQLTHDSIFLGEDGPTHQPIEQLAALRAMPNIQVIRPATSFEVKMAWIAALTYPGPTALILSRQSLVEIPSTHLPYKEGVGRGAYIVKKEENKADYILFATGSELSLAMEVAEKLESMKKQVRVVSFPCRELFEKQEASYQKMVLGSGKRVFIEASSDWGWYKYLGSDGIWIGMHSFGKSAPASALAIEFHFTAEQVLQKIL
jgi:transketolase